MQDAYTNKLATPIKKIRDLSIHSPDNDVKAPAFGFFSSRNRNTGSKQRTQESMAFSRQELKSPVRYPSMSDFSVKPVPLEQISQTMIERGYSRTLSNKVLRELDIRANEISRQISTNHASTMRPSSAKLKRYNQFHKPIFQKMESISSHYAATRNSSLTSQSSELLSSASKKRRTLNGPEEIFSVEKENESPIRRKESSQPKPETSLLSASLMNTVPPLPAEPSRPNQLLSSPYRCLDASPNHRDLAMDIASQSSSPTKFTRISPSKGSMNLNKLLLDDFDFVKPEGPVKIRQSSLQMAGVVPTTGLGGIPRLQKKSSSSSLQSSLNKKPSIGNLLRDSMTSLQPKPSLRTDHARTDHTSRTDHFSKTDTKTDTRAHGTLTSSLPKNPLLSLLQSRTGLRVMSLNKKPLQSHLDKSGNAQPSPRPTVRHAYNNLATSTSQRSLISQPNRLLDPSLNPSRSALSLSIHSNVTVPKPFSLYNKPTISSSQKSFGGIQASASLRSLGLSLMSKSADKLSMKSSYA
ncbi:hypothetical protein METBISCDRAFT_25646 [Metschnikowia bicuspidata]|uniref:Uncharacterized protein n=1 Tax=Metschnikowia bicuspidata TaxID=27322 RepID=A0A4P9ZHI8_9ASCO|nr:hypothetical protein METBISCDRAFT_25646 [Metschnikowia bicuspidata]